MPERNTDAGREGKILLAEAFHPLAIRRLEQRFAVSLAASTDEDYLIEAIDGFDALIVRSIQVSGRLLEASTTLRIVGRHGVGVENIDTATADRLGIKVLNAPGANAEAVAEFVLATAVLLTRRILEASGALRHGELRGEGSLPATVEASSLLGNGLAETAVAVVGLGAIGGLVAGRMAAAGAAVRAYDPFVDRAYPGVAVTSTLEEALEGAALLTLHAPLTSSTIGLIGRGELESLSPGAAVVNTARSRLIDRAALLDALDRGRVGQAVIDTFDREPPPSDDPLLLHPRILATPHIAGLTQESVQAMSQQIATAVGQELYRLGFD